MKNKTTYSFPVTIKEGESEKTYDMTFAKMRRSTREEADIFYSKSFYKMVESGIMPAAVLQKKMIDAGAILDEKHVKKYDGILEKLVKAEREYQELVTDLENKEKNEDRINQLSKDIALLSNQSKEYELSRINSSEHTAEKHAYDAVIQWIVVKLAMFKPAFDDKAEWTPFFKGNTDEERLADLEEKEFAEDDLYIASLRNFYIMAALAKMGIEDEKAIKEYLDKQKE